MTHAERRHRRRAISQDATLGGTIAEIASRHQVSVMTVVAACQEFGVAPPSTARKRLKPRNPTTFAILADLFRVGTTLRKIADAHGVSPQRVHQIYAAAQHAGVPVPEREKREKKQRTAR